MLRKSFRQLHNDSGSTLIMVLLVFTVLMLLGMAALTASTVSTNITASTAAKQQADFIAQSAAKSAMSYIQNDQSIQATISALPVGQTISGNADFSSQGVTQNPTIKVKAISSTVLQITVNSTYRGVTGTATAYLRKNTDNSIKPFDSLLYIGGDLSTGIGQCSLTGDVTINGKLNLSQGSKITGQLLTSGDVTITGAGAAAKGLKTLGNVELGNSGAVGGDLYAKGNLKLSGGPKISGNVFIDGSITTANASSDMITGNATCGKTASFSGGSNQVDGTLTCGSTYSPSGTDIYTFVKTKIPPALHDQLVSPVNVQFTPANTNIISPPSSLADKQLYQHISLTNSSTTITNDGMLDNSSISGLNWGTSIYIDPNISKNNINILINSNFTLSNGYNIFVKQSNYKVFFYLTGNSSITVPSNSFIGMENYSTPINDFIIGDCDGVNTNQSVTLTNNSRIDAYLYIPNGSLSATGSDINSEKFCGSACVKSATIDNGVDFKYIASTSLTGTPLDGKATGSGSGSTTWSLSGWSSQ